MDKKRANVFAAYICAKFYAAYIPESDGLIYAKHSAAINSIPKSPNDTIIVLGDFNIPNSNWLLDDDNENVLIPISVKPQFAADFIENIMMNGLHQINSIRNEDHRLLDLVFTNDYTNVELSSPPPLSRVDKQYHPPLLLSFELHTQPQRDQPTNIRNFKKTDWIAMNNYFDQINFTELLSEKSLEEMVDCLHDVIGDAINKFVPWQLIRSHEKCPWTNKDLRALKNTKNKEWKKYKSTGVKEPFIQAHEKFSELNKQLYENYVDKVTSSLHSDPSSFQLKKK